MSNFKCREYSLPLGKKTYIMGILNVTPDSFFDGGKYINPDDALEHALKMQQDGADIIDVGAQSTRPGHIEISAQEEIERLKAVFPMLRGKINVPISVDTYNVPVAKYALENGADIINDVSGKFNDEMAKLVKEYNAGWILTHTGETDSDTAKQYDDVVLDVSRFFTDVLKKSEFLDLNPETICFDIGIGFGKSKEDNIALLDRLNEIEFENAIMVGVSRKRFLQKDNDTPKDRLAATIAANTKAIIGGADILRVHDVFECVQAAKNDDSKYRKEQRNG